MKLHGPVLFTVLFLSLLTAVNATVNSSSQLITSHMHTCPIGFTEVNNNSYCVCDPYSPQTLAIVKRDTVICDLDRKACSVSWYTTSKMA